MRALIIDDAIRGAAKQLMAHARKHIYRPDPGAPSPGDDPNFVLGIPNGYKCVFTYTDDGEKLFRHLSVSVSQSRPPLRYPSPEAVFAIAELFEYSGTEHGIEALLKTGHMPETWMMAPHPTEPCIVLAEPLS